MPGSQVGQPADLGNRLLARLIDFVLLGIISVVIGVAVGIGSVLSGGPNYGASALSSLISAAISLGYFAVMEAKLGQTLGKMLIKLRVVGPGGGNPTMEQALKRNAWTALGVIGVIPFLGWLGGILSLAAAIAIIVTINNNTATRQGWHDTFAGGTTVIKVG